jgi:predicted transcriptional regulator
MNTAEIKLDLFRRIDSLSGADLKRNYEKIVALLNVQKAYKLNPQEGKAIQEAVDESKKGNILTHEQVLAEAKQKYSNLKFE